MRDVLRILFRFFVVPLAMAIALLAGFCVVVVAEWNVFLTQAGASPDPDAYFLALTFFAPMAVLAIATSMLTMLSPAAVGILASEFFAIRSWIFHVANGVLSIWIGWSLMHPRPDQSAFLGDPKVVLLSGLAAGVTYWLVAGWNAGLWVAPVERRPENV
ncbi:MAG: hypothetical protein HY056_07135 [Proteobacteria bacterium]|nr:hypothetical protein [Pseudomonadota bacterium]